MGVLMKNKIVNHSWFSKHSHEVIEVIGNIAAVAVFIGITYLILRYLIKYG
jgi:nitrate reductase gamma subunit